MLIIQPACFQFKCRHIVYLVGLQYLNIMMYCTCTSDRVVVMVINNVINCD